MHCRSPLRKYHVILAPPHCPGGEIGRHRGLKIPRSLRSCRFKSGSGHHSTHNKNSYLSRSLSESIRFLIDGQYSLVTNSIVYRDRERLSIYRVRQAFDRTRQWGRVTFGTFWFRCARQLHLSCQIKGANVSRPFSLTRKLNQQPSNYAARKRRIH